MPHATAVLEARITLLAPEKYDDGTLSYIEFVLTESIEELRRAFHG